MPDISFIVLAGVDRPVYLKHALTSLLMQTSSDWEAIVVDACRDLKVFNSVCQTVVSYGDDRLKYVCYPKDEGVYPPYASRKWNFGIAQSSAPLIAWLDDDDKKQSTFVEEMTKPFREDPALDVAVCGGLLFDDGGGILGPAFGRPELTREALVNAKFITTGQMVVRRTAHDAISGFDEVLGCAEDYDYCLRLAGRRWRHIDGTTCLKRHSNDSASASPLVSGHTQVALRRIVVNQGIAEEICRYCSTSLVGIGGFVRFSPGEGFRLFCGPHCAAPFFGES